ncbi:MAG: hypothetical protein WBP71_10055 [Terracidiphilus sp.]
MALFTRRFLQRALDGSTPYLSVKQRQDFCNLLNTVRDNYLSTEWELAVLHALNALGSLNYEPAFPGTSHPDVLFTADGSGLSFAADITSVSDRGLHQQNPYDALQEEFLRRQRKLGMLHGGFDVRVNSHTENLFRGSGKKPRLKLPKRADFPSKIFNADFQKFMVGVRDNPDEVRLLHIEDAETSVHFSYSPARRGFGGGSHPSFDLTTVIDKNPIYNALSSKADQLRKSEYNGLKGILLCDAGCWSLHQRSPNMQIYARDEIVRHFLRQNQSVSFVVALIVEEEQATFAHTVKRFISPSVYLNNSAVHLQEQIERLAGSLVSRLPIPEQSPRNAMSHLKRKDGMTGRHLATLTKGTGIEMSARMLLEILAGQLSVRDFEQNYRIEGALNPFRRMLEQGRLIEGITVEPHPEADDDRVTIRFGKPDSAIAPFRCD